MQRSEFASGATVEIDQSKGTAKVTGVEGIPEKEVAAPELRDRR